MTWALPVFSEGMPLKPKWGEPCNGCGYCCQRQVCLLGLSVFGANTPAPCPALNLLGDKYACGLIEAADEMSPVAGFAIRAVLGVGVGCDAE